jgi:hypothetical protein
MKNGHRTTGFLIGPRARFRVDTFHVARARVAHKPGRLARLVGWFLALFRRRTDPRSPVI